LGNKIIELRKQKGLSQGELASLLNIHQSMVTRWEKDKVQPRPESLNKLGEIFGISLDELSLIAKPKVAMAQMQDPKLSELLSQLYKLNPKDLDALKSVIEAMLTKARVQEAIGA